MKQNKIYIYGRHAVYEAIQNTPKIIRKIYLSPQMEDKKLRALVQSSGITVERLDPRKVTSHVEGNAPHQGIVALIGTAELELSFEDFMEEFTPNPNTLLILMNEIQDPHNVGAIVRSAVAFGATAVLMPTKKQAPISPAAVKASAGMVFRLPLVSVPNVEEALTKLKAKGVRIYGMAGNGKQSITEEPFRAPTLLILGNEGSGIPGPIKALCDMTLSIPMDPRAESLNVAASAAVAMYAWSTKHGKALS
jgi:23S rRNA (guanosine2251-2'-O)-methyltransferase